MAFLTVYWKFACTKYLVISAILCKPFSTSNSMPALEPRLSVNVSTCTQIQQLICEKLIFLLKRLHSSQIQVGVSCLSLKLDKLGF